MSVRKAVVAGQFYEGSSRACREQIESLLPAGPLTEDLPERIIAGIVPHAGWVFSGELAARVLAAVAQQQPVDTFVIFGAVHSYGPDVAAVYDQGQWDTPLGPVAIDEELAAAILAQGDQRLTADRTRHNREHSIEVQVPIIRRLFESARIVPIMAPPMAEAPAVGRTVAHAVRQAGRSVVCLGSTDLTHYGPSYGFTPMGTGAEALRWAKQTNDRFFLDKVLALEPEHLVDIAHSYGSACGAGAVAATVAAARELGARQAVLLGHTSSAEVVQEKFGRGSSDSVGYAGVVFG